MIANKFLLTRRTLLKSGAGAAAGLIGLPGVRRAQAADAVKMMFKEDLTPQTADPLIYKLAPFISLICAMGTFAIIPFTSSPYGHVGDVNAGVGRPHRTLRGVR